MRGILFDARVLRPGMTGIGNFARSLMQAMPHDVPVGILLEAGSPYAGDFPGCRIHFTRVELTSHPRTELYEQFVLPLFCLRFGYRSFVSFEGRVPVVHPGVRTYAFIYDLAYRSVQRSHSRGYTALLRLSHHLARWSGSLVTISRTVRDQIASTFHASPEKILVVYPSDSGLKAPAEPVPGVSGPFLLAVSMTNKRKNLENLLRGFGRLRANGRTETLVITGRAQWVGEVIAEMKVQGVLNAGFATEGQLRYLYEHAKALIYPSLDEGFGIPLLDAAGFGCPVACSDIAIFREVMGDEALYFDPLDPASIAASMARVLESPVRADAAHLAQKFSWKNSAAGFAAQLDRLGR